MTRRTFARPSRAALKAAATMYQPITTKETPMHIPTPHALRKMSEIEKHALVRDAKRTGTDEEIDALIAAFETASQMDRDEADQLERFMEARRGKTEHEMMNPTQHATPNASANGSANGNGNGSAHER
jgi:hypothetical protein